MYRIDVFLESALTGKERSTCYEKPGFPSRLKRSTTKEMNYPSSVDCYLDQMGCYPLLNVGQETAQAWRINTCRLILQARLIAFPIIAFWLSEGTQPAPIPGKGPKVSVSLRKHPEFDSLIASLRPLCHPYQQTFIRALPAEKAAKICTTLQEYLNGRDLPVEWLEKLTRLLHHRLQSEERSAILAGVENPVQACDLLVQAERDWYREMNALVEPNLRLVVHLACRYRSQRDSQLMDLIQEGNLGLLRAVRRFDVRQGHRFSTYATYWIHLFIDRAALRLAGPVQRPVKVEQLMRRFRADWVDSPQGARPSIRKFAFESEVSEEQIDAWLAMDKPALSIGPWNKESFVEGLVESDMTLWKNIQLTQLRQQLEKGMKTLSLREKQILYQRFGLDGDDPQTLQALANRLGLSRERVRQIEMAALSKLHNQFGPTWQADLL